MNDRFDQELRKALQRVEPPEGFTERVLARAAEQDARPSWQEALRAWFEVPWLRWAAVAAMCVVMVAGYQYRLEMQRRADGERAKDQVLLALQITAQELHLVGQKVESLRFGR